MRRLISGRAKILSPKGLKRLEDIARVDVRDGRAIVSFMLMLLVPQIDRGVFTVLAQPR